MDELKLVAWGSSDMQPWAASAPPGAKIDDLLQFGKKNFEVYSVSDAKEKVKRAQDSLDEWLASKRNKGDVVDDETGADYSQLILRAHTTIAEAQLVDLYTSDAKGEALRGRVRPIIRCFRDRTKAKERDCINAVLYAHTYAVISSSTKGAR